MEVLPNVLAGITDVPRGWKIKPRCYVAGGINEHAVREHIQALEALDRATLKCQQALDETQ